MGDEQIAQPHFGLQPVQQAQDTLGDQLIQRGCHLVADDEFRLGRQGAGNAQALLLAAGQLARQAVDEAVGLQLDLVQQLTDAGLFLRTAQPAKELQRPAKDLAHAVAGVQRGVGHLVDHLHPALQRAGPLAREGLQHLAIKDHLTRARRQQPHHHPRRGGFPRTAFAHHRDSAPARHGDGDVAQHRT